MIYKENPEKDQDRAFDTLDHFNRFGFVLFPQNKKIYENLCPHIWKDSILEAGCGAGIGTAILDQGVAEIKGTDRLERNVKFARELYPWIEFEVWDIAEKPWKEKYDIVICVEAIEHIKNYREAIKNLIASAKKDVWISTPNRTKDQPTNPFHVREFTPEEILEIIGNYKVEILHWDTFEKLDKDTKVNPLVYHIIL